MMSVHLLFDKGTIPCTLRPEVCTMMISPSIYLDLYRKQSNPIGGILPLHYIVRITGAAAAVCGGVCEVDHAAGGRSWSKFEMRSQGGS